MPSSIKVKFYIEHRRIKLKDNTFGEIREKNIPIIFSVSYGGRYVSFTGIRIDKNLWDKDKSRVKSSHTHAAKYNKTLSDLKKELEDICLDARNNGIRITNDYIRANLTVNKLKSMTGFFDYYKQFVEISRKHCQPGTITKYITIQNHLQEFADKKQFKIEFDTLNENFLSKFLDFYFDDKKFINSYVKKNLKFIRQFLTWAEKKGFNKNPNYKGWKLETGQKQQSTDQNIVYLTIPEFLKLYKYNPIGEAMIRAKDYLILACSTGLRFSDIAALKKTDVNFVQGVIKCTTIKTGDFTEIPFNEFSRKILEKYKNSPNYNKDGVKMAFPAITNQKTNKNLKLLCEKAKINDKVTITHYKRNNRIDEVFPKYKLISTHTGRKTFITFNVWLGVESEITMGLTTHKSHETMEKYYSVNISMKRRAMKQFSIDKLKTFAKESAN